MKNYSVEDSKYVKGVNSRCNDFASVDFKIEQGRDEHYRNELCFLRLQHKDKLYKCQLLCSNLLTFILHPSLFVSPLFNDIVIIVLGQNGSAH